MTTFCLIHGSGQGPEGWQLLARELEARGQRVLTPAMDITATDKGATWHADSITAQLRTQLLPAEDLICVAHSASGIYLPLVAASFKARLMVFVAALIPRPGMSIAQQFQLDRAMFNPAWIGKNSMVDQVAAEFVYHDCEPERLAWALSTRLYFYAKKAMEEEFPLPAWPSIASSYVLCKDDRTISPEWQLRASRDWLGVEPYQLPGGHCPHVSRPELLAQVLVLASDA